MNTDLANQLAYIKDNLPEAWQYITNLRQHIEEEDCAAYAKAHLPVFDDNDEIVHY